jgi:hypothetical protein
MEGISEFYVLSGGWMGLRISVRILRMEKSLAPTWNQTKLETTENIAGNFMART